VAALCRSFGKKRSIAVCSGTAAAANRTQRHAKTRPFNKTGTPRLISSTDRRALDVSA
jgi:hypothetical protein